MKKYPEYKDMDEEALCANYDLRVEYKGVKVVASRDKGRAFGFSKHKNKNKKSKEAVSEYKRLYG